MKVKTAFIFYLIMIISIAFFLSYGRSMVTTQPEPPKKLWTNPQLISKMASSSFVNTPVVSTTNNLSLHKDSLIAHALGGIQYRRATNSLNAMELNYTQNNIRFFETDLILTSDNALVARHDWLPYLYDLLEQDVPSVYKQSPLTYEDFMGLKINQEFYPLDFKTLATILKNHPDIFLITDTKSTNPEEYLIEYNLIVEIAKEIDDSILDRIVIEVYNEQMYRDVIKIYPFKNIIYALYMNTDGQNQVLNFCKENHIEYISLPKERVTPEFIDTFLAENIKTFVHTVNDAEEAKKLKAMGVWGIYSDFLINY